MEFTRKYLVHGPFLAEIGYMCNENAEKALKIFLDEKSKSNYMYSIVYFLNEKNRFCNEIHLLHIDDIETYVFFTKDLRGGFGPMNLADAWVKSVDIEVVVANLRGEYPLAKPDHLGQKNPFVEKKQPFIETGLRKENLYVPLYWNHQQELTTTMSIKDKNYSFEFLAILAEIERIKIESVHYSLKRLEEYWEICINNLIKKSGTVEYQNFIEEMKVILELKDALLDMSSESSSLIEGLCLLMEQKQHNQSNDDGTE